MAVSTQADICIRQATEDDAAQLLAIYAPYVQQTAITFETQVPSLDEFQARIHKVQKRYPYLVLAASSDPGCILGYAYVSAFRTQAAYDWCVETSLYLRQDARGTGLGRALHSCLEDCCRAQNILNLNACIAVTSSSDDPHLSNASVHFHEKMDYRMVGTFSRCGYKFDRWYDMVWMEKLLGEHAVPAAPVVPFAQVAARVLGAGK